MSKLRFKPIIGLEVHIELGSKSKMFCACSAEHFAVEPNTHTCPVCLGLPGALPYPNKRAIEWTILVGLALNCQINPLAKFDRKNYFYPDLPKGYQISQYDLPLAINGSLKFRIQNSPFGKLRVMLSKAEASEFRIIRIRRVHLEEDTGKLIHKKDYSMIDFNRAGVPLMEIVTEPDIDSAEEAKIFLQGLQQLVRYLGVGQADMEKGQMRCEPTVNLEIQKERSKTYTPLVELKNINSYRFVQKAIDFEIQRQRAEFERTGVEKEPGNKTTRGWSETRGETVLRREKEEAEDYRYFPEPDIPPLRLQEAQIASLKSKIGELPWEKLARLVKQYNLSEGKVQILTETSGMADYFENVVRIAKEQGLTATQIANLLINKRLNSEKLSPEEFVKAALAKKQSPGLKEEELEKAISEVLEENQAAVADYNKGKTQVLEFLVGQVARKTKGKADPNLTRKLLLDPLNGS